MAKVGRCNDSRPYSSHARFTLHLTLGWVPSKPVYTVVCPYMQGGLSRADTCSLSLEVFSAFEGFKKGIGLDYEE